jgi:Protein of unknown function (DUF3054)
VRHLAADLAVIVAFAALGRRTHAEGVTVAGVAAVAAPFAVAWTAAFLVGGLRRDPASWRRAALLLPPALAGALALRAATGGGTAPAFVVVAALFLALTLVGRRAAYASLVRARSSAVRAADS